MVKLSKKGLIPIALTFAIVISLILAAAIGVFWSKAPFSVNRVKRFKATQYAEAALYEAFNRFRTGYSEGTFQWNANSWPAGTTKTITVDSVQVTISVAKVDGRNKVSATVKYRDISL